MISSKTLTPSPGDKKEEKRTKPVAVKEEKGKKLALSFDMDGCLLTYPFIGWVKTLFEKESKKDKSEENIKVAIKEAIKTVHGDLVNFLVRKIIDGHYSEIIIMMGSTRQTVALDERNSTKHFGSRSPFSFALSSFPVLEGFKEVLEEELVRKYKEKEKQKPSPKVTLDTMLLGDFCVGGGPPGKIFDEGIKLLKDHNGCWPPSPDFEFEVQKCGFATTQKLALQYAQLHRLKTSHPHSQIGYLFFDDRKDTLDALSTFYSVYPCFIPSDMQISHHMYINPTGTRPYFPVIIGTGIAHHLDPNLHNFNILFNFKENGFLNTDFYKEVSKNRLNFFFAHPAIEKGQKVPVKKNTKKGKLIKKIEDALIKQKAAKDMPSICHYKTLSYALEYLEKQEVSDEELKRTRALIRKRKNKIEIDEQAVEIHSLQYAYVTIKERESVIGRFFQYQFTYSLKSTGEQKEAFVSLELPLDEKMGGPVTECAMITRLAADIENTEYQASAISFLMKAIRREEDVARAYGALCKFNKEVGITFLPRDKTVVAAAQKTVVPEVVASPGKLEPPHSILLPLPSAIAAAPPLPLPPSSLLVTTPTPPAPAEVVDKKPVLVFPPAPAIGVPDEPSTWWQRRNLLEKGILVGLATAIVVGAALTGIGLIVEAALGVSVVGASLFIGAGSLFSAGAFTTGIAAGGIGAAVISGISAVFGGLFYYIKEQCFSSSAQQRQTPVLPDSAAPASEQQGVGGGSTRDIHSRAGIPSSSMRCSSALDHSGRSSSLRFAAVPVSTNQSPQDPLLPPKPL